MTTTAPTRNQQPRKPIGTGCDPPNANPESEISFCILLYRYFTYGTALPEGKTAGPAAEDDGEDDEDEEEEEEEEGQIQTSD